MNHKKQQKYSFFQAIYMSFYSKSLYKDIATNWFKSGHFFTLRLSMLISLICFITFILTLFDLRPQQYFTSISQAILGDNQLISKEDAIRRNLYILSSLPSIEYNNGNVHTKERKSFTITDPLTHKAFLTIDTEDLNAQLPSNRTDQYYILKSNGIIFNNKFSPFSAQDKKILEIICNVLGQLPAMNFNGEVIKTAKEQAYLINIYKTEAPKILIDTRVKPKYTTLEKGQLLLINDNSITVSNPLTDEITKIFLSDLNSELLEKQLYAYFKIFKIVTIILLTILLPCLILFIFAIISTFVLANTAIAKIISDTTNLQLSKHAILRISAVATLPILVITLLFIILSQLSIIFFIPVAIFYMNFAVKNSYE